MDDWPSPGFPPGHAVVNSVYADRLSHRIPPLAGLVAAALLVTLDADDSLWFGSSASDQYELARNVFGCSDRRLVHIARTGGRAVGMSAGTCERLGRGAVEWLNAEEDDGL